jgi:hypothetical protein
LVLYNLPQVLADRNSLVFVNEGEKAAEAARSIGLLATCSAHGAKSAAKTDWRVLAGRDVVILPDHDDAGERYAADVRHILLNLNPPAKVRIVRLPGLAEHGDTYDFVESHDAAESETLKSQILGLADKAEPETQQDVAGAVPELDIVTLSDVQPEPVHWLWRDRFPYGMLSLLVGIEGSGKTFLALDMAARISAPVIRHVGSWA